jgi:hypothetical protein
MLNFQAYQRKGAIQKMDLTKIIAKREELQLKITNLIPVS